MIKNAILVHGTCDKDEYFSDKYPSLSNSHWFPWLQKQLLIRGIFTQTPEMPEAHTPKYDMWKKEFEHQNINNESILIGHSCGAGFLLRWLSEKNIKVDKLILVAPWLDPKKEKTSDFFDFSINKDVLSKANNCILVYSTDDDETILSSVKMIIENIPNIQTEVFKDKGHFCYEELKSDRFPELLKLALL